ncbi:hypothetical protein ACRAWF_19920 [Streptomyces sp. L7]
MVLGAFREAAHDEPDLVGLGERLERSGLPRPVRREVRDRRPRRDRHRPRGALSSTTATRPR